MGAYSYINKNDDIKQVYPEDFPSIKKKIFYNPLSPVASGAFASLT